MVIEKAVEASDELLAALADLIPQLPPKKTPPGREELTAILKSPNTSLLIARAPDKNSQIVGVLTLVIYRVPTGVRSIIEDIVVDNKFRRQGIAKALLSQAIQLAREAGAGNVSLTSNPSRQEANLLYQRLGFQLRNTNAYILNLK